MDRDEALKLLRGGPKGIAEWNRIRVESGELEDQDENLLETKIYIAERAWTDLSKADLSGADLSGADLSGADLSGADLSGADLSGANLSGANLFMAKLENAKLPVGFDRTTPREEVINKVHSQSARDLGRSQRFPPIRVFLDPGNATQEQLENLYVALDNAYRARGGSGLRTLKEETRECSGELIGGDL